MSVAATTIIVSTTSNHAIQRTDRTLRGGGLHVSVRVLNAAESQFAQLGFGGASLRRIAAAAGTSESGVLRIFDSKENVFTGVLSRALELLLVRINERLAELPNGATSADRLAALATAVFNLYAQEPDKVALIFSECGLSIRMLRGPEGQSLMALPGMTKLVAQVTQFFKDGIQEGTFSAVDPIAAREVFFGMIEGTILGWLLAAEPSSTYNASTPENTLVVIRRMLAGLS